MRKLPKKRATNFISLPRFKERCKSGDFITRVEPLEDGVGHARPQLGEDIAHQAENAENDKYLDELPPVPGFNLGLDEISLTLGPDIFGAGRESTGSEVLLHKRVLLVPPIAQPLFEGIRVVEGDVRNPETAPVQVY